MERVYTHQERMRVVGGILLCMLLAAVDQTVVLPAVPAIGHELRGHDGLSWIITAYLLTSTATTPIYGKLSDQFGRRAVLGPAILLFVAASALCALPRTLPELILARALQGLGGGGLMAITQAAIADVIPPRERGKYQGWFASIWGLASIAGPIIGGLVVQHASWRLLFWANLPLGALAFVLCRRGLAGLPIAGGRRRIDWAGSAVLTIAASLLLYALSAGSLAIGLGAALVGAAGMAALPLVERRAADPLFPGHLFTAPGFRLVIAIGFLNAIGMFAGIFLLPLDFQLLGGAGPSVAGFEVVPFLAATTAGSYVAGQLARRSGRTRLLMARGLLAAAAGFALMGLLPSHAPWLRMLISAVLGAGLGFVMPTSLCSIQNEAPRRDVGAATGTLLLLRAMGGALGATIAGAAVACHPAAPLLGFRLAYLATGLAVALGAVLAFRLKEVMLRTTLEHAVAPGD